MLCTIFIILTIDMHSSKFLFDLDTFSCFLDAQYFVLFFLFGIPTVSLFCSSQLKSRFIGLGTNNIRCGGAREEQNMCTYNKS